MEDRTTQEVTFVRMINPLFRHLTQAIVVTNDGTFLKVSNARSVAANCAFVSYDETMIFLCDADGEILPSVGFGPNNEYDDFQSNVVFEAMRNLGIREALELAGFTCIGEFPETPCRLQWGDLAIGQKLESDIARETVIFSDDLNVITRDEFGTIHAYTPAARVEPTHTVIDA